MPAPYLPVASPSTNVPTAATSASLMPATFASPASGGTLLSGGQHATAQRLLAMITQATTRDGAANQG